MAQWSEITGINYDKLRMRKVYGWSDYRILSTK